MRDASRHTPFDVALSSLATRQHGVVTLAQLKALGLSSSGVRNRVAAGRLHRIHRGVYAVGHARLTDKGRWLAAVLACGPDAALSHRSAASHLGLLHSTRSESDVTTTRRAGRLVAGVDAHFARRLDVSEIEKVEGIRCTTVARTLLDLADVVKRRVLERAVDKAEVLRVFDGCALEAVLERAAGRRGAPLLRSILKENQIGATITESELEEHFLALCGVAGIPLPLVNQWILLEGGAVRADFLWPDQRLIVETDGRRVHATSRAFEHDRRRDQRLMLAGYRVVRCTWRQVVSEPQQLAATIRRLLGGV